MIQSRPMINNHKHAKIVRSLVKIQLSMGIIIIVILTALKHNLNSIFSGIVGLFLAIIPTIVYAKVAFGNRKVLTPNATFMRHKKAMISRFILNLLLFAIVIILYRQCDYIALFATYFVALAGYWVSLIKQ